MALEGDQVGLENLFIDTSPFSMSFLFSQVSWNSKSEQEHSEWQDETVQVCAALLLLVEERQLDTIRHIVKC